MLWLSLVKNKMPEQERYQGESQFSSSLVVSEWLSPPSHERSLRKLEKKRRKRKTKVPAPFMASTDKING